MSRLGRCGPTRLDANERSKGMLSFRSTTVVLLSSSQSVPRQSWSGYSPCATPTTDRSLALAVLIALVSVYGIVPVARAGSVVDCNANGIDDACDLSCGPPGGPCDIPGCGTASDCNANGIPDECDLVDPMWTLKASTGPSPRQLTPLAYDSARNRPGLFGGNDGTQNLADTWEWDGGIW